jgi:hypothetical protein
LAHCGAFASPPYGFAIYVVCRLLQSVVSLPQDKPSYRLILASHESARAVEPRPVEMKEGGRKRHAEVAKTVSSWRRPGPITPGRSRCAKVVDRGLATSASRRMGPGSRQDGADGVWARSSIKHSRRSAPKPQAIESRRMGSDFSHDGRRRSSGPSHFFQTQVRPSGLLSATPGSAPRLRMRSGGSAPRTVELAEYALAIPPRER